MFCFTFINIIRVLIIINLSRGKKFHSVVIRLPYLTATSTTVGQITGLAREINHGHFHNLLSRGSLLAGWLVCLRLDLLQHQCLVQFHTLTGQTTYYHIPGALDALQAVLDTGPRRSDALQFLAAAVVGGAAGLHRRQSVVYEERLLWLLRGGTSCHLRVAMKQARQQVGLHCGHK